MKEFYNAMLNTAENAEIKVFSDDDCCQVLAWLYAYGGGNEAVVYNMKLNAHVLIAQKRFNIFGGEVVNQETHVILQKYLQEVEPIMNGSNDHPEWVFDFCARYKISPPKRQETV